MGAAKEFLKQRLSSIGYELKKNTLSLNLPTKAEIIQEFKCSGSIPWSMGYDEFKEDQILSVLANSAIMQKFQDNDELPKGFGIGLDERIIEYPWFLSQVENANKNNLRYLDAGPVMNHEFIVNRARKLASNVHFTTLSHEENCFHHLDISYLFADLINLPIKDNFYDLISCISTLEHVGCDNVCYGSNTSSFKENQKNFHYLEGAKELLRVLKPGGSLYITVPFGKYMHLGMIQQFDQEMIERLTGLFDVEQLGIDYYRYDSEGWQKSNQKKCLDSVFVKWLTEALMQKKFPTPHPVEQDLAAAARSVCCLQIKK